MLPSIDYAIIQVLPLVTECHLVNEQEFITSLVMTELYNITIHHDREPYIIGEFNVYLTKWTYGAVILGATVGIYSAFDNKPRAPARRYYIKNDIKTLAHNLMYK